MDRKTPPPQPLDPGHEAKRAALAKVGLGLLTVGLPCGLIGVGLFLTPFFTDGFDMSPAKPVAGMILAFVGAVLSMFGLQAVMMANAGKILRYQAGEALPVARDAAPHAAPMLTEMARAVAEGFSGQVEPSAGATIRHSCGALNDPGDRFCKGCGVSLAPRLCPSCQALGEADANFCAQCGSALTGD